MTLARFGPGCYSDGLDLKRTMVRPSASDSKDTTMHYPRRNSRIKRARKQGFRARMRTPGGRKMIKRQRAKGRHRIGVEM